MLVGLLALTVASVFSGAALYVSVVEHQARSELDTPAMLAEWKPAYRRGTLMQSSLAIAGFVLGAFAWWQTGAAAWLVGALLMIANWPYTLIVVMPVNRRLSELDATSAGAEARTLMDRWARLHAVRTALGFAAVAAFLAGAA